MTKKEYITQIQTCVREINDITCLDSILNYIFKEYAKDLNNTERRRNTEEQIRYTAALDAIYNVESPEKLELIERFARRLV